MSRAIPRRAVVLHSLSRGLLAALLLVALVAPGSAFAAKIPDSLPAAYQEWLQSVEPIITKEERDAFLTLEEDYQRDAFIERFWRERDPDPKTARNELKDRWESLQEYASATLEGERDERRNVLFRNGPPAAIVVSRCAKLYPVEAWLYQRSDNVGHPFVIVFYRPFGAGSFRIWHPVDGLGVLTDTFNSGGPVTLQSIALSCPQGDKIAGAIAWVLGQGRLGYTSILAQIQAEPPDPGTEWVATFEAYSTQLSPSAGTFEATLDTSFPGRRQSRTVVQGVVAVPTAEVGTADLAGNRSYNLLLNGEVLRDGQLFDSFRYKFDFPASVIENGVIPLVFERSLRPFDYTLVVKVEDLNSGKFYRAERAISVPALDTPMPAPPPSDPVSARLLAEANALLMEGEVSLRLMRPPGELLTDMVRFETLATGDIAAVRFVLNGEPILTDKSPPYSVELDLGDLPRVHALRAEAVDAAGVELASAEILVNSGGTRFRVHLTEPHRGRTYSDSLRASAELEVPEGETVERLEIYLDETRIATLYDEPWSQPIVLPEALRGGEAMGYVRAVAYLADGNSTEDTAFFNAPAYMDEVDVQLVELYATVLDRAGRPIQGLGRESFRATEDGVEQQISRFEQVRDLPIHAGILLDVSASMNERVAPARDAALQFFQQILRPKDRGALITFNDRPNLSVGFTNEVNDLAGAMAGIKAERGTALYDSVIFSLYYFNGIKGQKALLLLSDGKDESSRFAFQDVLEYARRAGVTIYSIGLALPRGDSRRQLTRLAEETGGRSFFVETTDTLPAIYGQIEEELRSQYLIAYQSTNTDPASGFRRVTLDVARPGTEVKTMTGYYP